MAHLAVFTLKAAQARHGGGNYVRGATVTCHAGSQGFRDLKADARWSGPEYVKARDLSKERRAILGHEQATSQAQVRLRNLIRDLEQHVTGMEGAAPAERAALAEFGKNEATEDRIGMALERLAVCLGISRDVTDADLSPEDLKDTLAMLDDGQDLGDDEPELGDDEPELGDDLEPPPAPTVPSVEDEIKAAALADLCEALASGGANKGDIVRWALLAGLDGVDKGWEESPSNGGLSSADLRNQLRILAG